MLYGKVWEIIIQEGEQCTILCETPRKLYGYTLEDKFWPPAAVAVNVQSLLHANSRYLQDIHPAQGISEEAKVT